MNNEEALNAKKELDGKSLTELHQDICPPPIPLIDFKIETSGLVKL